MDFNYTLKYRTFDQLLEDVTIDLHTFALENMIEPQQLIKLARKLNYELGLRLNQTKEAILDVTHHKVKLPDDFYTFNFGMICGDFKEIVGYDGIAGGTNIQEVPYREFPATVDTCAPATVNCRTCNSNPCNHTAACALNCPTCNSNPCTKTVTCSYETIQVTSNSCTAIADMPSGDDPDTGNFAITINGILYPCVNLWTTASYLLLQNELNALIINGEPAGQFTITVPLDLAFATLTVVGTNSYQSMSVSFGFDNWFTSDLTCTSFTNDIIVPKTVTSTTCPTGGPIPTEHDPNNPYGNTCIAPRVFMNCKGEKYELIQVVNSSVTRSYKALKPLRMKTSQEIECDCPNLYYNTPDQGWIKYGFLNTTFETGKVYLNYQGDMSDDNGNLLVPDHELLNEYYEYALKARILENLFLNGEDVSQRIQLIEAKLRPARNQAISLVNTPNFKEMEDMWWTNRRAMYGKYYSMFMSHSPNTPYNRRNINNRVI